MDWVSICRRRGLEQAMLREFCGRLDRRRRDRRLKTLWREQLNYLVGGNVDGDGSGSRKVALGPRRSESDQM